MSCGTGVASSTTVVKKIEAKLNEAGIDHVIKRCKVTEVLGPQKGCDLIVSTADLSGDIDQSMPIVQTLLFITGIGVEADLDKIVGILQSQN